ncbi:ABC transporter permease [Vibrio coralliilyticus]|uniref:ABC transporter permease n=1 Tax=Vibrio coralliilyticus TaxID=190893 RepID=UPI0039174550
MTSLVSKALPNSSKPKVKTANGKLINKIAIGLFIAVNFFWLGVPFIMALLWSLVDPEHPWSYPDVLPQVLSFGRWTDMWENSGLVEALQNSYTIAPAVAILTVLLALPTAYALGRIDFRGKRVAEVITLLPLVMPGMIIGVFFSSMLIALDFSNAYIGIVIGHTVLALPYAIRILSASFKSVPQDLIDASRDLGGNSWTTFKNAYLPMLKPGLLASLIFCLVISIEEFNIAFVLGSPDYVTVPTILYSYLGYSFIRPNAAVVSLILVIPNVILMLIIERLLKGNYLAESTGKA